MFVFLWSSSLSYLGFHTLIVVYTFARIVPVLIPGGDTDPFRVVLRRESDINIYQIKYAKLSTVQTLSE